MKKTVKLLDDKIDVDVRKFLDGKLLLQANTGGGKSWAIRRILEQLYGVVPQIILDTEGEFHTLREKFDYILVAKGQPITVDYKSAGLLAHKMIESRSSFVIDLFEQTPYEREMFVRNFVEAMTNAPKKLWLPTLLVVDEAQTYAPEGDKTECGRVLHDAAFKFRKRHFGIIFATPRVAVLSKNVTSTCRNKLIGYTSEPNDVKRAAYELGFASKDEWRSLRDLEPGQFFAFGPSFSKEVITVQIGPVRTKHGEEGEVNTKTIKPSAKTLKALAVLATVPQEAAQELQTVADLKSALTAAKREITTLQRQPSTAMDPKAIEKIVDTAVRKAKQHTGKEWQKIVQSWQNYAKQLKKVIDDAANAADKIAALELLATVPIGWMSPDNLEPAVEFKVEPKVAFRVINEAKRDLDQQAIDASKPMGEGERKVLIAIAQYNPSATRELVTLATGYKRSTRDAYIARLAQKGFVGVSGNSIDATDTGIEALGNEYQPLPSGRDLLNHYLQTLPDGEKKVLQTLADDARGELTREQISEATGYKRSTRDAYIQRLRVRQIINLRGDMIKISDHLV